MDTLNMGEKLKAIRKGRNMTLEETAELTGVSKSRLGQIENGKSWPTVNTLWKISTGLKIPFSTFLQKQESEYETVDFKQQNYVSEENGKMRAYTLFSFDPVRSIEAFYIEFDPQCEHHSGKRNDGVEEYVFVIQGKLDMILNGKKISLDTKQAIRFEANIPHSYINPYENTCSIYNTISYRNEIGNWHIRI